jgi:uncharacterized protein (DUF2461 family)
VVLAEAGNSTRLIWQENAVLAEGMRFELTVRVDPVRRFSKPYVTLSLDVIWRYSMDLWPSGFRTNRTIRLSRTRFPHKTRTRAIFSGETRSDTFPASTWSAHRSAAGAVNPEERSVG